MSVKSRSGLIYVRTCCLLPQIWSGPGCVVSCILLLWCQLIFDIDNIAPPVAACLGDLVTLLLLGTVSTVNILLVQTPIPLIILIILSVAAVAWAFATRSNKHVSHLLSEGWLPLFAAMVISCGTGIVLDLFVSRFEGFALLAIVISGKCSSYRI